MPPVPARAVATKPSAAAVAVRTALEPGVQRREPVLLQSQRAQSPVLQPAAA
jgi:hypothetical protein